MVNSCCVSDCFSRSDTNKDVTFHRIPKIDFNRSSSFNRELSERRRSAYDGSLAAENQQTITTSELPQSNLYLGLECVRDILSQVNCGLFACNQHIVYQTNAQRLKGKPAELFEEDHPDWVPSLYMGHELEMDQNKGTKRKRKIKPSKDRRKQSKNSKDYNTQYVKTLEDKLLQCRQKFQSFESEIKDLKEKLNCCMFTFTEESFQDNDAKVKFYTGLPNFVTLMSLLRFLSPHISNGTGTVTTKFQKLLMVLMRLHLNLPVQLLADVFQVSDSTVSIIFEQFIDIMYILMKPVITWPDRKTLKANVPCEIVQQFGKEVMIIINSFEICIEMPSNPLTRAEILSSNEKQNTLKYLIGITPQGTVSFVTKGWGGKSSSKYLAENCSLLDNLDPGDLIVADWGLESAGLVCAEVTVSEFSGQKQLCAFLAEPAKTVQVRNFMERVVGKIMQKYSILNSSIPFTFLNTAEGENTSTLDKVVLVCCALVNMCPSQVSFDEDKVNLN